MTDDFLSALMDMDSDAETWGEKIGRAMATKIVEQMLTIQPVLDNIQNAYAGRQSITMPDLTEP